MTKLTNFIKGRLSVKISLMAVSAMAVLLIASLVVMLLYSRKKVREETLARVTLTLDATVQNIDNILLSVEQATGNVYYSLPSRINNPEALELYRRKLIDSNPYVADCTIALGDTTVSESKWTVKPVQEGKEPLISFSVPLYNTAGQLAGYVSTDVSIGLLSRIVAQTKPSENSFCVLLDSVGNFIVHPDAEQLIQQSAIEISKANANAELVGAVQAMIAGQTDYRTFRLWGTDFYVYFKPFSRSSVRGRTIGHLGWSAGIIYPERDIFGDYNNLQYYVLVISIIGLLLTFLLSHAVIKSRLKPLLMLTSQAQHIAAGNFSEPIPDSKHIDEVGRLQDKFQLMQRSLATQIDELESLKNTLYQRCEGLRKAYDQAKKADRMKTSFLHNMTNQMTEPADAIEKDVLQLCSQSDRDTAQLVSDVQKKGKAITELLKNLISMSDDEMRKEADHD
ncbi:methyl-accepting chemotaxis protein [Xylanibacter ruminicola]|uniref:histidine kinase n=1 Tax=Xylanibacter ruminicola TaxID=839 RepID=A0A1H3YKD0_XYLRU|nr:HAMP domain-containing protein [Xylanibacter ruminicola]SEA12099.1 methyl-accepting chemotaxis protein [Xylanibacter ruminicola]